MLKYDSHIDFSVTTALTLIAKHISPNSRVLEFGPATGYMTKYLKETLNCKVVAVELDPESAKLSGAFCEKMIVGDIDHYPWDQELKNDKFDHIIFSDVLEHLYDPWSALKKASALLSPNGTMLTSIPNIGHSAIIMSLLSGEFDYQSLGLMDRTHIRFFTRKSVIELLRYAQLEAIEWLSTQCTPTQSELKKYYHNFSEPVQLALKNRPDAEVYQFVTISKASQANDVDYTKLIEMAAPTLGFDIATFSIWFLNSDYKTVHEPIHVKLNGENHWTRYRLPVDRPFDFKYFGFTPSDQPALCSLRNIILNFTDGSESHIPIESLTIKKSLALQEQAPNTLSFICFGKTTIEYEKTKSDSSEVISVDFEMKIDRDPNNFFGTINESLEQLGALKNITIQSYLTELKESNRIIDALKNELNKTFFQKVKSLIKNRLNF